jgi:hypothetical protein
VNTKRRNRLQVFQDITPTLIVHELESKYFRCEYNSIMLECLNCSDQNQSNVECLFFFLYHFILQLGESLLHQTLYISAIQLYP